MVDEKLENNIHEKGFDMDRIGNPTEYCKIKVGMKTLADATLDLGTLKRNSRVRIDKAHIVQAMADQDLPALRELSEYFYRTNGIYQRVCNYFATMYRYD